MSRTFYRWLRGLRDLAKTVALINIAHFLPKWVQARLIARSDVFDFHWFLRHAVAIDRAMAAQAFVRSDVLGRAANPLFDPDWYRDRYGLNATPAEALLHYILLGDRIGLRSHPWFDAKFYRRYYGLGQSLGTALGAFLRRSKSMPIGHPLFDADWYRSTYADVASADINPLLHFVEHGLMEGRQPNAYLMPAWYLKHNPDVAASGMPPAMHYCMYGAQEGRNPGPGFDARRYAAKVSLKQRLGMDPLSHFLTVGRQQGAMLEGRSLQVRNLIADSPYLPALKPALLDVIIPVYRGLEETRACIESVLASQNRCPVRLRLHNDASPEPEVSQYLRDVSGAHANIVLVENPVNLGFVGTVNDAMRRAMECADFSAVVLLNSDTVVANDWLDRLLRHVDGPAGPVATVTALSNNATICSFPKLGANALPRGFSVAEVDALAAKTNAGAAVTVPTGVGFCMLITKQALTNIGIFDEEAFGRGYGEENDFCMRALQAGYQNLLALDVFVQHVGEVSFADVSKPGKINADRIIRDRYPDYHSRVGSFCEQDPALVARLRLTFALWRAAGTPVRALITHSLGGGTERHVQETIESLREEGPVVILRPVEGSGSQIRIENPSEFDGFDIEAAGLDAITFAELVQVMGVTAVQIHHTLGHGDWLRDGLARSNIPFEFVVHDYYMLCPQITLSTIDGQYCGEPSPEVCDACIARRPAHGAADIRNWRHANEWLALQSVKVRAPSYDTAKRVARHFGIFPEVTYHESVEHTVAPVYHRVPRLGVGHGMFRVLIIGALARHKGRNTILSAVETAKKHGLPLTFHLIGDTQGDIPVALRSRLTSTGWYKESQLAQLISDAKADMVLFASPIPETYSYTLTAAMRSGLPIVATDIGAYPERLRGRPSSLLVPYDIRGDELARKLLAFLTELAGCEGEA